MFQNFENSLRTLIDPLRGGDKLRECGARIVLKALLNGNPRAVMLRKRDQVAKAGLQRRWQPFGEQLKQRIGHRPEAAFGCNRQAPAHIRGLLRPRLSIQTLHRAPKELVQRQLGPVLIGGHRA